MNPELDEIKARLAEVNAMLLLVLRLLATGEAAAQTQLALLNGIRVTTGGDPATVLAEARKAFESYAHTAERRIGEEVAGIHHPPDHPYWDGPPAFGE